MRRSILIFVSALLFYGAKSFSQVNPPYLIDPWKEIDILMRSSEHTEADRLFLLGMQKLKTAREEASELLQKAALMGSSQAELLYYAEFSNSVGINVAQAFLNVDSTNNPKILYEVGKLMQLGKLYCLNKIEKSDGARAERRCFASKSTNPLDQTVDQAETEKLFKARQERIAKYIVNAAILGYPPAQLEMGYLIYNNKFLSDNPQTNAEAHHFTAKEWLQQAANAGNIEANNLLNKIIDEENKKQNQRSIDLAREKQHQQEKPNCEFVFFSGIGSAGSPHLIEEVLAAKDPKDTLARNPIICGNGCYGLGYFNYQRAKNNSVEFPLSSCQYASRF